MSASQLDVLFRWFASGRSITAFADKLFSFDANGAIWLTP